ISVQRNRALKEGTVVMRDPTTRDFYNDHDPLNTDPEMVKAYEHLVVRLSEDERTALGKDLHFYEVTLENIGGLVMPVIIEWAFVDGTTEIERIPAEIWKIDDKVTKVFVKEKEVAAMLLDPYQETADTDLNNNAWPTRMMPSRFDIYKQREQPSNNPMRTKRGRGIGTEGP
ncbi:MAG: M1 family peptidase, partial [Flavobacteriales bacterium]|nr:M1 family peptidase [Flavobacteriales bacterium]